MTDNQSTKREQIAAQLLAETISSDIDIVRLIDNTYLIDTALKLADLLLQRSKETQNAQ